MLHNLLIWTCTDWLFLWISSSLSNQLRLNKKNLLRLSFTLSSLLLLKDTQYANLNAAPLPWKLISSRWKKKGFLPQDAIPGLLFFLRIWGWKGQGVFTPSDVFSCFFSKFKQIYEAIYGEVYTSAKCVLIKGRLWSLVLSVVAQMCWVWTKV